MRFLSADFIFPCDSPPIKNGVLVVDENGSIVELLDPLKSSDNQSISSAGDKLELSKGVIVPGFVNTHCHLELSHLKGKFEAGKGLPAFLKDVVSFRMSDAETIQEAMVDADAEMVANGIVAVGDISNVDHSFSVKTASRIQYHTFIELFDLIEARAIEAFKNGVLLQEQLNKLGLAGSFAPHASYSVTQKLFRLITEDAVRKNSILSMHNQETESEDLMFIRGEGELYEFIRALGNGVSDFKASGSDSLHSVLPQLPEVNSILLVHNTFSSKEDIRWANSINQNITWCFCPNANKYIENRLPDIPFFKELGAKISIGTDSYASNWSLSVLDELKTIQKFYPGIKLETLIQWACSNGAEFLKLNNLGSFKPGKMPGVNLIMNLDELSGSLTDKSSVIPLF